jgi:hypothetical protein
MLSTCDTAAKIVGRTFAVRDAKGAEPVAFRQIGLSHRRHQALEMKRLRASVAAEEVAAVLAVEALVVIRIAGLDQTLIGIRLTFLLLARIPMLRALLILI